MATVVRKGPGDTDDKLIAKFRKKVLADNVLTELRDREYYKKPSLIRKELKAQFKRHKSSRGRK